MTKPEHRIKRTRRRHALLHCRTPWFVSYACILARIVAPTFDGTDGVSCRVQGEHEMEQEIKPSGKRARPLDLVDHMRRRNHRKVAIAEERVRARRPPAPAAAAPPPRVTARRRYRARDAMRHAHGGEAKTVRWASRGI